MLINVINNFFRPLFEAPPTWTALFAFAYTAYAKCRPCRALIESEGPSFLSHALQKSASFLFSHIHHKHTQTCCISYSHDYALSGPSLPLLCCCASFLDKWYVLCTSSDTFPHTHTDMCKGMYTGDTLISPTHASESHMWQIGVQGQRDAAFVIRVTDLQHVAGICNWLCEHVCRLWCEWEIWVGCPSVGSLNAMIHLHQDYFS